MLIHLIVGPPHPPRSSGNGEDCEDCHMRINRGPAGKRDLLVRRGNRKWLSIRVQHHGVEAAATEPLLRRTQPAYDVLTRLKCSTKSFAGAVVISLSVFCTVFMQKRKNKKDRVVYMFGICFKLFWMIVDQMC
uniref:Transmembrane protein n=2 Tax=Aegilops tauschii subsp. strangulata TaxID=200361 RepID=A0A452XUG6_AEGTS